MSNKITESEERKTKETKIQEKIIGDLLENSDKIEELSEKVEILVKQVVALSRRCGIQDPFTKKK